MTGGFVCVLGKTGYNFGSGMTGGPVLRLGDADPDTEPVSARMPDLLLAAEAMGIGAIPQAAVSHHAGLLRQHLGIPPEQRIVSALSFGMEDADHPANRFRTDRAGVEDAAVLIDG